MNEPPHSNARPRRPLRWAVIVGWLLVIAPILLALASATGSMSERELVEASLYVVLTFGFGVGLLIGARWLRDVADPGRAHAVVLVVGLIVAGIAAYGRSYFLSHYFYR